MGVTGRALWARVPFWDWSPWPSFAPLGLFHLPAFSHGLRHGLHSFAAPRLEGCGTEDFLAGRKGDAGNRLRRIVKERLLSRG